MQAAPRRPRAASLAAPSTGFSAMPELGGFSPPNVGECWIWNDVVDIRDIIMTYGLSAMSERLTIAHHDVFALDANLRKEWKFYVGA